MVRLILLFALSMSTPACWTPRPPEPAPPEPEEAVGGGRAASCETVCDRARELKCSWGENTPEGGTCEGVCQNYQESGFTSWNLKCRSQAKTCAAMDLCEE